MDIYKLKFTRLQNEIFRLLCVKAGRGLSQRKISEFLDVSATAVSKALKELEREELIRIDRSKDMNLTSVGLNRDNPRAASLKRAENLKMIYESGLADALGEEFPGCAVILFGSYSYGEDTEESDIDVAVIGLKGRRGDFTGFEKILERKIHVHFYGDLEEINRNLKSNILNGITVQGMVEA